MRKMRVVIAGLLCFAARGAHSETFEQQVLQINQQVSGALQQTRQALAASQAQAAALPRSAKDVLEGREVRGKNQDGRPCALIFRDKANPRYGIRYDDHESVYYFGDANETASIKSARLDGRPAVQVTLKFRGHDVEDVFTTTEVLAAEDGTLMRVGQNSRSRLGPLPTGSSHSVCERKVVLQRPSGLLMWRFENARPGSGKPGLRVGGNGSAFGYVEGGVSRGNPRRADLGVEPAVLVVEVPGWKPGPAYAWIVGQRRRVGQASDCVFNGVEHIAQALCALAPGAGVSIRDVPNADGSPGKALVIDPAALPAPEPTRGRDRVPDTELVFFAPVFQRGGSNPDLSYYRESSSAFLTLVHLGHPVDFVRVYKDGYSFAGREFRLAVDAQGRVKVSAQADPDARENSKRSLYLGQVKSDGLYLHRSVRFTPPARNDFSAGILSAEGLEEILE